MSIEVCSRRDSCEHHLPSVHGTPAGLDAPRVVRVPGVLGTLVGQSVPCVVRVPGVPGDPHTQDQRLVLRVLCG